MLEVKKVGSGRPASAWGKAIARTGPPDPTFFISGVRTVQAPFPSALVSAGSAWAWLPTMTAMIENRSIQWVS